LHLFRNVCYESIAPYQGRQVTLFLRDGRQYTGQIVQVYRDGILFHSSNPGFFFLPFAAIALLALSFGVGYSVGRTSYPRYGWGGYPYF